MICLYPPLAALWRRWLQRLVTVASELVAVLHSGSSAIAEEAIKEEDKIKKPDAKYQDKPKGQQRCEICLNFQPPSTCKIVQGPVTRHGWCQLFAAKENAH
jgi:hypothetical protein